MPEPLTSSGWVNQPRPFAGCMNSRGNSSCLLATLLMPVATIRESGRSVTSTSAGFSDVECGERDNGRNEQENRVHGSLLKRFSSHQLVEQTPQKSTIRCSE